MAANNHRPNVLDIYNGRQLLERYRLDREGIEFLEAELNQFIGPVATRNRSMTVTEKILITLRYLATGGIQLNDGDIHYVSQPSVSRAVGQVIDALANPHAHKTTRSRVERGMRKLKRRWGILNGERRLKPEKAC
ncbi:hypothetical protein MAR_037469, partial [Mya arenaria]